MASETADKLDTSRLPGIKPKDLLGIPWQLAFALRADGWYLRSDIIWAKPNPMPESVTDRPTNAHEHVFMLAKSRSYFYDADAIREPHEGYMAEWRAKNGREKIGPKWHAMEDDGTHGVGGFSGGMNPAGRNKRNVWSVATQPYSDAHFATFPRNSSSRAFSLAHRLAMWCSTRSPARGPRALLPCAIAVASSVSN